MLENIEIHVVDHCNLNCYGCDNFSPIAKPWLIKVDNYCNQLEQLAKISNKEINEIRIMGGEPLLHPDILDIIRITRNIFNESTITLLTNGILLHEMNENFWLTLKEYNVQIWLSIYDKNKVNYYSLFDIFDRYKINHRESHSSLLNNSNCSIFHNLSLVQNSTLNFKENWDLCYLARGNCTTLRNGKIFHCECSSLIDIFNKKFNTNFIISENDYMDIYTNTFEEICEFIQKPIPFCKYCNTRKRASVYYPHMKSRKEITEWI